MLDKVIFYFFAGIAVGSAALMVTRRNAVHSAIFLITTLLATAGIFLQLRAEFIFIVQIILYVGGIMVLFIFVIMLVNLDVALHQIKFARQKWVALIVTLALTAQTGLLFWTTGKMPGQGFPRLTALPANQLPPNAEAVAKSLFSLYLLPFEIASVLLLVAMIGGRDGKEEDLRSNASDWTLFISEHGAVPFGRDRRDHAAKRYRCADVHRADSERGEHQPGGIFAIVRRRGGPGLRAFHYCGCGGGGCGGIGNHHRVFPEPRNGFGGRNGFVEVVGRRATI
jgi:NADH-quinone oxidoreductase subunit J